MDTQLLLLPQYAQSRIEARQEQMQQLRDALQQAAVQMSEFFKSIGQMFIQAAQKVFENITRWMKQPAVQHILASMRRAGILPPVRTHKRRTTRNLRLAQRRIVRQDVMRWR